MKNCNSVLRRQILEDVLGEKVEEYENFHKSKLNFNKRQHRKLIPLWKFLLHLLSRDKKSSYIEWNSERALEFRILDTQSVAELWGSMKNKTDMTYEKLGRAMRYYYGKSIIEKVNGKRYSYRFILSRRTKKYISQFVNTKGMKIEPIDKRCESPDHSNSDSASVGSAVVTSEEDESNLLYDTPSPASPIVPITITAVKPTIKTENFTTDECANEYSVLPTQPKIRIIKRETSRQIERNLTKQQITDGISEMETPIDEKNQFNTDTEFNQFDEVSSTIDMKLDNEIDEKPIIMSLNIKQEDMLNAPITYENQFSSEVTNTHRNLLHTDATGFYLPERHLNDEMDIEKKQIKLSDEYDDSDLSSLTSSISSEDFDNLDYIDIDYLKKEYDSDNDMKIHDMGSKKAGYQNLKTEPGVKLNRHIDPFMGCDFVRLTEIDRSALDVTFTDMFEEYLF